VVGTSQPPEKSIPAKVLNLERSVGGFEKIKCVLVGPGSGCHIHLADMRVWLGSGCGRHFPATRKSIPAIVLKSERSVGGFENFKCVCGEAVAWLW